MPCFDPEDVIFITNKWDCIRSQLDVEKEKEKVWEKTKRDIKRKWEFVKEEHIFRMNCLDVSIETKTMHFKLEIMYLIFVIQITFTMDAV